MLIGRFLIPGKETFTANHVCCQERISFVEPRWDLVRIMMDADLEAAGLPALGRGRTA